MCQNISFKEDEKPTKKTETETDNNCTENQEMQRNTESMDVGKSTDPFCSIYSVKKVVDVLVPIGNMICPLLLKAYLLTSRGELLEV